jgi:integrase
MPERKSIPKFVGVYYRESEKRKWRERPDRIYWVSFKDSQTGKLHWERCGWASEGWTPERAQRRRFELLEQDRTGEYQSKKERRQNDLTFKELMEGHYLPWSDQNKRRWRDDRSRYKTWLEPLLAEKTLNTIGALDLERLKRTMRDKGKSDATVRHALCLVRQAFNKAVEWRLWAGENPCKAIRFPKPNNARLRFLSHAEADTLMQALAKKSKQIERVARLSLYGGFRVAEIFSLSWSNVDRGNRVITILDTKNGESRPIFISPHIKAVLDELTPGEPDEPIFKTRQKKSVVWLSKSFQRVINELGWNKGITDRRQKVTFHTLRHSFASWSVMAGVPLYQVGKALGHKTTTMTARYSHLSPDSQRAAFEAVSRFAEQSKEEEAANEKTRKG